MKTEEMLEHEDVAATDAFFARQPIRPKEPEITAIVDSVEVLAAEDEAETDLQEAKPQLAPLHEAVRELQAEFEEQQEEGKI